jgi:hypothetical protein
VAGFGISGVEPRVLLPESQLISKMDLRETGCDAGRWMDQEDGGRTKM